jgi:hypothetical protein
MCGRYLLLIAEAHNPQGRRGILLPLIADTNIQEVDPPDSADPMLDPLPSVRLNDEREVPLLSTRGRRPSWPVDRG